MFIELGGGVALERSPRAQEDRPALVGKILDAIDSYAAHCASNELDWPLRQRASIHRTYGSDEELDAALCRLALEFPERTSGHQASLLLAERRAVCPAD